MAPLSIYYELAATGPVSSSERTTSPDRSFGSNQVACISGGTEQSKTEKKKTIRLKNKNRQNKKKTLKPHTHERHMCTQRRGRNQNKLNKRDANTNKLRAQQQTREKKRETM